MEFGTDPFCLARQNADIYVKGALEYYKALKEIAGMCYSMFLIDKITLLD